MAGKTWKWSDYEQGRSSPRQGSVGSASGRPRIDENAIAGDNDVLTPTHTGHDHNMSHDLGRRRSSLSMRLNSITQIGGVNSIESFARSWQRAVNFHDIAPNIAAFAFTDERPDDHSPADDEDGETPKAAGGGALDETPPAQHRSLLSRQLEEARSLPDQPALEAQSMDQREQSALLQQPSRPLAGDAPRRASHTNHTTTGSPSRDLFTSAANLSAPFSSSFGSGIYGSFGSRLHGEETGREDIRRRFAAHERADSRAPPDKEEREPLLLRRVEASDGHVSIEVVGQSTIYQTVLNSTNVLVGVGILSLPFGLRYAGWVPGLLFLSGAAGVNVYTSRLLGRCLRADRGLVTFADLAYVAFGPWGQLVIAVLFMLELGVACVALFVLFADSLALLVSGWSVLEFKAVCAAVMFPLSFVPLRWLGYTSSLGIICCITIVVLVLVDGLIKPHAPGSLRDPAPTYLFPERWSTLPLSFGLLMAPWGGLTVFPNIYRDMRHPRKWNKSLNVTFGFTYILDMTIAIIGLLMFGDETQNEITSNIFLMPGGSYPAAISYLISCCITIIPITKIPLNARPIYCTIEHFCGLGPRPTPPPSSAHPKAGPSPLVRSLLQAFIRLLVTLAILLMAILCPSFDRVMAIMGSVFCFSICVVLPVSFYLRLFGRQVPVRERIVGWVLIVTSSALAIVGTVWAFLPKSITGA